MKKLLLFLIALALFPWAAAAGEAGSGERLTLMVYLCGSDLESRYGSATLDMREMEEACRGNSAVTVLLMAGGSAGWTGNLSGPEETAVYEIGPRGTRAVRRFPAMNMGRAETLSAFLEYGFTSRPADRYALIFWDHGGGPLEGVCFDDLNGMDSLSLQEIAQGLRDSPFSGEARLSWIGFDACLMADLETALTCAPYADYMVASQETEPASGWNYAFLRNAGGSRAPLDTCGDILSAYPEDKKETDLLTLSLIDLRRMDAAEESVNRFFDSITMRLDAFTYSAFARNRQAAKSYGRVSTGSDYDLVDLADLAEKYAAFAPAEAEALQAALSGAVLRTAGNQERAGGLSVYFPFFNKAEYTEKWQPADGRSGTPEKYGRFLSRFGSIWTGEPLAIWDHLTGAAAPPEEGIQRFSMELTDEQVTHFAGGAVHILEDDGSDSRYHEIYCADPVTLDGNTLTAEYRFEALYAVDENGVKETEAIPFEKAFDYYLIFAQMGTNTMLARDPAAELQNVMLVCKEKEGTKELEILDIYPVNEASSLNLGKQHFDPDPEKWKVIRFTGNGRTVRQDNGGSFLPFTAWHFEDRIVFCMDGIARDGGRIPFAEWAGKELPPGMHAVIEADNTRPWTLKFCPRDTSGNDLAAQFVLMDTQANRWGSNLIPLRSPDTLAAVPVRCEPAELPAGTIQPYEIKVLRGESFQGICLRFRVNYRSERMDTLLLAFPRINGISRNSAGQDLSWLLPSSKLFYGEETGIADFYFGLSRLPCSDDPVIRSVSFLPGFNAQDSGNVYGEEGRISFYPDLDLSALQDILLPPDAEPLARDTSENGLMMELLELAEGDSTLLRGRIRVTNRGEDPVLIGYKGEINDRLGIALVNDTFVHNCLEICDYDYCPAGGTTYFDFNVLPDSSGQLPISGSVRFSDPDLQPREQDLSVIGKIGFFVDVLLSGASGEGNEQTLLYTLPLPEPLTLNHPVRVYFDR